MSINSAQRAALQKRKRATIKPAPKPDSFQIKRARDATVDKLFELFEEDPKLKSVAKDVETAIFETSGGLTTEYRAAFRRTFVALKDPKTHLLDEIKRGSLSGQKLAQMSPDDLKSNALRSEESELKTQAIKEAVRLEVLPENIQQVHDGRDREKWGITRSAAAID